MDRKSRIEKEKEIYLNYTSSYLCGTPFSIYGGWPYIILSISLLTSLFIVIFIGLLFNYGYYRKSFSALVFGVLFQMIIIIIYFFIDTRIRKNQYERERENNEEDEESLSGDFHNSGTIHGEERKEQMNKKEFIKSSDNIMKAIISKAPQSIAYFLIILLWISHKLLLNYIYLLESNTLIILSNQKSNDNDNDESIHGEIDDNRKNIPVFVQSELIWINYFLSVIILVILIFSYIQRIYNNILTRSIINGIYAIIIFIIVIQDKLYGEMAIVQMIFRTLMFFVLFIVTEVDGRSMLRNWMKYLSILGERRCDNILICVSDDNLNAPVIEIQTERKKVIFVLLRSIYQSIYILFIPIRIEIVFLVFLTHITFLIVSILKISGSLKESAHKKFDDINIESYDSLQKKNEEYTNPQIEESKGIMENKGFSIKEDCKFIGQDVSYGNNERKQHMEYRDEKNHRIIDNSGYQENHNYQYNNNNTGYENEREGYNQHYYRSPNGVGPLQYNRVNKLPGNGVPMNLNMRRIPYRHTQRSPSYMNNEQVRYSSDTDIYAMEVDNQRSIQRMYQNNNYRIRSNGDYATIRVIPGKYENRKILPKRKKPSSYNRGKNVSIGGKEQ